MRVLFWVCAGLIGYAYVGYAACLLVYARFHRRPITQGNATPRISVVMAVRNEAARLPQKLANLRRMEYPQDMIQIVVASDGSTDETNTILLEQGDTVTSVFLSQSGGKAAALNAAVRLATGDLLVFMDVRQTVDLDAVQQLVSCFADPEVGAVSGELHLETTDGLPSKDALGIYWKIEKMVRRLESATGSVVGVTGAIYAIRRELYVEIPPETLLDDVYVPMYVAKAGKRVVFQSAAIARDRIFTEKGKEFSRKVRTLTGNYQLLRLAPWMLSLKNPLLFRLISHKLLRLTVPLFLVLMLFASATLGGMLYRIAFWGQVLFYGLAALGAISVSAQRNKVISIAYTFVVLNFAAATAFYNVVAGRKKTWA